MATASVTYSFSPNTTILSSEANTDFADLVTFLNGEVIHKDGTIAATAHLSGPLTDPSSAAQYANKQYVDRLGIVARESLPSNSSNWALSSNTDMNLDNVPVVSGRTYAIHLHTQYAFSSVDVDASWSVNLELNGSPLDRFMWLQPRATGSVEGVIDSSIYWTPSVTQATDDLLVVVTRHAAGATLEFRGGSTAKRTLTVIDLGVL